MRFSAAMEEIIQVRVARDEKRRLVEAARRRGQTLSEMMRESVSEAARRVAA
jgi:uncharacterized protein (DUF1778 family)